MIEATLSEVRRSTSASLPDEVTVKLARDFVANYFLAMKRADLALMVGKGEADDFAEIQAAIGLLGAHADKIARYESALAQYADQAFWDQAMPGGALAFHDNGEMARNVIAGRPAFYHRD
jgi:hypothetical protein